MLRSEIEKQEEFGGRAMVIIRTMLFAFFGFTLACLAYSLWKMLLVFIIAITYKCDSKACKGSNENIN